jgi:sugar O-acyltransferase (sialic acid O-acetyltransferase NeuD family)
LPKKRLLIVGAGNLGRELLCWARDIPEDQRDWNIGGFLDDNQNALDGYTTDFPVISSISNYIPQQNDVFSCAIADPKIKLKICNELLSKGATFVNVIHPTCVIGDHNRIGTGLVMCPFSSISTNVTIGDFVTINLHCVIAHDAEVGDGVTLSAQCDIMGFVKLDRGVFLGSGARMLPKTSAGEFSTIGAGCVVLDQVEANRTVVGVPAKYIK